MALIRPFNFVFQSKLLCFLLVFYRLFIIVKCDEDNLYTIRDPAKLYEAILNHGLSPEKILPVNSTNKLCAEDSRLLLEKAKSFNVDALHVLDSWAKIPSGILYGNINQFGNFDQCIKTGSRYCLASFKFKFHPKFDPLIYSYHAIRSKVTDSGHRVPRFSVAQWGLCLPETCSSTDIEITVRDFLSNKSFLYDIEVKVEAKMCQTADDASSLFTLGSSLAILFFGFVFLLCVISTAVEPILTRNWLSNEILASFSLRKNWKILKNTDTGPNDMNCIDGIRFMSAISLLLSHKQMSLMFLPYVNRTPMAEVTGMAWSTIGRTAILHTDSFIFLSGFLTARGLFNEYEKYGQVFIKHNIISRIFRLTPNLLAVIVFCTWILPAFNSGPLWPQVITTHSDLCKKNYWKNLFYIHNFYPFEEMCLTHTHQLGIDMQLYLSSFILIYLIWNRRKTGFLVLILVAAFSTYLRYTTTIANNLSSIVHFGIPIERLMKTADYSYIRPSHRITVYIMGIVISYYLHVNKNKVSWSKILIGWMSFLSFGILAIFGPYTTGLINYSYDPSRAAIYSAFAPILWCSFVSWGLISSYFDYAGWFGKFLSWKGFKIFTRIAYAVYLTQFPIFFYNVGRTKISTYYSQFDLLNVGELFCILIASILLTLLFDLPFQNIMRVLLPKKYDSSFGSGNIKIVNNDIIEEEIVARFHEAPDIRQRHIRFHG